MQDTADNAWQGKLEPSTEHHAPPGLLMGVGSMREQRGEGHLNPLQV